MTKFQKFQLYFSVVPGISSVFVFFVTMFRLKRRNAPFKEWLKFMAVFFGFGALASIVDAFVMTGENPVLNVMVFTLIMMLANYLCIHQQGHCEARSEEQARNHKKVKVIPWIISGAIAFTVLIAALIFALAGHFRSGHIEDMNGAEDTSLAVITREDFVCVNSKYAAMLTTEAHTGEKTDVTGLLAKQDHASCSVSAKKLSGIRTLQATQTDADSVTLHVSSTLSGGNMELIIVIDGQYDRHIPVNGRQTIVLEDIAHKLILVKLAAESAEVTVVAEREISR